MSFDGDGDGAASSRFVEVHVTQRLEVTDLRALRAAVEVADGPAQDELDQHLRSVPANLVGRLLQKRRLLPDVPGTAARGSSTSVDEYVPDDASG